MRLCSLLRRVLLAVLVIGTYELSQTQRPSEGAREQYPATAPELAIPAILKAFDTYEVVAIPAAQVAGRDGYIPTKVPGDILGHEFMGIVEDHLSSI